MSVSKERVLYTSRLARLNLTEGLEGAAAEAKLEEFALRMDEIVGYMDILQEADTAGVEPMFSPMCLTAPPREDEVKLEFDRAEVMANAPEQSDGFFVVPRVL